MSVNISNYELALAKKINQEALTTEDALLYAQAIKKSQVGTVFTVTNFNDLPSGTTVPIGSIYYVDSEAKHYVYDSARWRLLADDWDSSIWMWGSNSLGGLGDNTSANKSSPVSVVGGFTNWCQVDVGSDHTLALKFDKTLWAWGSAASTGNLGDGTTVAKSSPISVIGGYTWCQASAGTSHSVAIKFDGTLWAWGQSTNGKLGAGDVVDRCSPVSVVGGYSDWCQVSASNNTFALRTNGTAWGWGDGTAGMVGDGTTVNKSSPVSVIGGFTDWCQISSGLAFTVGTRLDGTIWSWGCNSGGYLGDGTTVNKCSPVSIIGGFTWCQVSAGALHSAAIRNNGTLWTWGRNACGQLGDGTVVAKCSPVSVVGGFTDWCQATGGYHTVAIRTNGTLWAWGLNGNGQLGDGTTVSKSSPVSVLGGYTWCQVNAHRNTTSGIIARTL